MVEMLEVYERNRRALNLISKAQIILGNVQGKIEFHGRDGQGRNIGGRFNLDSLSSLSCERGGIRTFHLTASQVDLDPSKKNELLNTSIAVRGHDADEDICKPRISHIEICRTLKDGSETRDYHSKRVALEIETYLRGLKLFLHKKL